MDLDMTQGDGSVTYPTTTGKLPASLLYFPADNSHLPTVASLAHPFPVTDAATAGGYSTYSALSSAAVLTAQVKGSAGQVGGLHCFNNTGTIAYGRLYNQTGAPASTDTANIVYRFLIPANTSGAGIAIPIPAGIAFGTGIGVRVTYAIADNDTTVLAAGIIVNVLYK